MGKQEVPWNDLFENGESILPLDAKHTDRHILSLDAFLKPELEKADPITALGAQQIQNLFTFY